MLNRTHLPGMLHNPSHIFYRITLSLVYLETNSNRGRARDVMGWAPPRRKVVPAAAADVLGPAVRSPPLPPAGSSVASPPPPRIPRLASGLAGLLPLARPPIHPGHQQQKCPHAVLVSVRVSYRRMSSFSGASHIELLRT